jgi:ABC-type proline/glycine betaine transport system substrate-binding protein
MKRVLCLVLAVVLIAAVLAPITAAGAAFREREVTLIQPTLTSRTSLLKIFHACISNSASIPTKFARVLRGTATSSPPPTTTGTSSTDIGR